MLQWMNSQEHDDSTSSYILFYSFPVNLEVIYQTTLLFRWNYKSKTPFCVNTEILKYRKNEYFQFDIVLHNLLILYHIIGRDNLMAQLRHLYIQNIKFNILQ